MKLRYLQMFSRGGEMYAPTKLFATKSVHTLTVKRCGTAHGRVQCGLLFMWFTLIARSRHLHRGSHTCRLWELPYNYRFPSMLLYVIITSNDVRYLPCKFLHELLGHPVYIMTIFDAEIPMLKSAVTCLSVGTQGCLKLKFFHDALLIFELTSKDIFMFRKYGLTW